LVEAVHRHALPPKPVAVYDYNDTRLSRIVQGVIQVFGDEKSTSDGRFVASDLEKRRASRLEFMAGLYDVVDGFDAQPVETRRVAAALGLDMSNPDDELEIRKRVRFALGPLICAGSAGCAPLNTWRR
jgi:hypothetical protein